MPQNDRSLEDRANNARRRRSDGEILYDGLKRGLHAMIPIEGQIFYARNTRLPKPLAVMAVTAWQLTMYMPIVMYVADKLSK